jgi:hypothetical protein
LHLSDNKLTTLPETILSLTGLHRLNLARTPLSDATLNIETSNFPVIYRTRTFLKCYFALALTCSYPIIEAMCVNYEN